jgi:hypothetical protein
MLGVRNRRGSGRDPEKARANNRRWYRRHRRRYWTTPTGWATGGRTGTYSVSSWAVEDAALIVVAPQEVPQAWRAIARRQTKAGAAVRRLLAAGQQPTRCRVMSGLGLLTAQSMMVSWRRWLSKNELRSLDCGALRRGCGVLRQGTDRNDSWGRISGLVADAATRPPVL